LRSGHIRRQTRLLAGCGVLGLEITLVGDDVDPLDLEDFPRRLGGRLQQPHVDDLIGHFQIGVVCVLESTRLLMSPEWTKPHTPALVLPALLDV
jgi:hypothetical protein